jgi:hypothetical protein
MVCHQKVTDQKLQKEIQNGKLTGYNVRALPSKYKETFMEKKVYLKMLMKENGFP